MIQKPVKLRTQRSTRFEFEEVDSNWTELHSRTAHDEDGYNSIAELADKIMSAEQMIRILSQNVEHPEYISPSSFFQDITSIRECGTAFTLNLTQVFVQNDAGSKISETISKNGTVVSTTNTFSETLTIPLGETIYSGTVTHNQGPLKQNILGLVDPIGRIEAGTINTPERTITGIYPVFYGSIDVNQSINDIELNQLTKLVINSTDDVAIPFSGIVGRRLVILVPAISTPKLKWFVTPLNSGNIGSNGDLFDSNTTLRTYTSPSGLWSNISYRVYISSVTNLNAPLELRNS